MDTTIKVGTSEEKFEIMKNRLIQKGQWNLDEETRLRQALGINEVKEKTVEEIVNPPVEEKKVTKTRSKKVKK